MQGDAAMGYIARIIYTFARYLARRYQLPTDKMAEYWQKMADEKFAYIKKKQYLCSVI